MMPPESKEEDEKVLEAEDKTNQKIGRLNDKGEYLITQQESAKLLIKFKDLRTKRKIYLENYKKARAGEYIV
jgi:hypothetical protein